MLESCQQRFCCKEQVKKLNFIVMFVKIHRSYRTVVAMCDSGLLGKKFEEGIRQLDVRENFYNEREIDREEAIRLIRLQAKEDATFNIVGPESVAIALESGVIDKSAIGHVDGVPFALVLL